MATRASRVPGDPPSNVVLSTMLMAAIEVVVEVTTISPSSTELAGTDGLTGGSPDEVRIQLGVPHTVPVTATTPVPTV